MRHGQNQPPRKEEKNTGPRFGPGAHMRLPEKPKDAKKSWERLLAYCRRYLPVMIASMAISAAGAVLSTIAPDIQREGVDILQRGLFGVIDMDAFLGIMAILIWMYGGTAVLGFIHQYMMATVTGRLSKRMRADVSDKIHKLPLKYFDKTSFGDVISRMTNDVDTIGTTLSQSIGMLIMAVTMLLGSLVMMFYTNWIMALTAIGTSLVGIGLWG
jgi:ATP-binding cassette subfamily B protein